VFQNFSVKSNARIDQRGRLKKFETGRMVETVVEQERSAGFANPASNRAVRRLRPRFDKCADKATMVLPFRGDPEPSEDEEAK
jgi:hypothetical protein